MSGAVFDRLADHYDAWFDSARGTALFRAEVECLERLMPAERSGWVEVGVGSGRFAQALGVPDGVDPCVALLEMAAARGVRTVAAKAENLPYASRSLEGILLVVTLCFLDKPKLAMREFSRVLIDGGQLLVGIVPSDSPWGQEYVRKGQEGHPFYSVARFYTCSEALGMAGTTGFRLLKAASTLPKGPDEELSDIAVLDDIVSSCGFVGLLLALGDS